MIAVRQRSSKKLSTTGVNREKALHRSTPDNPGGLLDVTWMRKADGYRDLDARIWMFTDYYSLSPGMISQTPGKGAKYMIAFVDSDGEPLSGASSHRLHLPKDVPAANFWSLTLYEAENASGLANGQLLPTLRDPTSEVTH